MIKNKLKHLKLSNVKKPGNNLNRTLKRNMARFRYGKLTFILPYRKTNDLDREINLDITLKYLSKIGVHHVIISEHSDFSAKEFLIRYSKLFKSFKVIFTKANGELFNKSKAINNGVIESKTPYIAIYDIDCLTKKENIMESLFLLEENYEVVHPFNRRVTDIRNKKEFQADFDFDLVTETEQDRPWADGGIVFWNKASFIKIGMKNEYFTGWGGEDNEIMIRADLFNLKQKRINDTLYHLYHHRPLIRTKQNAEELQKFQEITDLDHLLKEIKTWPWVINANKKFKANIR